MTEPAVTEATAPQAAATPAPAPTRAEAIDAAVAQLFVADEAPAPVVESAPAVAGEEPTAEPEAAQETGEAKGEGDDKPKPDKPETSTGKLARRLSKQRHELEHQQTELARGLSELRQLRAELDQRLAEANPLHEIINAKDDLEVIERVAELRGTTSASLFTRGAQKVMGKPSTPEQEMADVRQELAELKAWRAEQSTQARQRAQQAAFAQQIDAGAAEVLRVKEPEFAAQYRFAAALPNEELAAHARALIDRDLRTIGKPRDADDYAGEINEFVRKIYEPIDAAFKQPGNAPNPSGSTSPAIAPLGAGGQSVSASGPTELGGANRSTKRDPQPTNRDAAGAAQHRAATEQDRREAAVRYCESHPIYIPDS